MANVPESASYPSGIYQLERTDPVLGGAGGIANRQAEQLASRTAWLRAEIDKRAPLASPALTGVPTAPTAALGTSTAQLASTAFVQVALTALLPRGMVMLWSGATDAVPAGWALCDGANGTPDLRERFVVGAGGALAAGDKGGATSKTVSTTAAGAHGHSADTQGSHSHGGATAGHALTEAQMPGHAHSAWTDAQGWHQHTGGTSWVGDHQHWMGIGQNPDSYGGQYGNNGARSGYGFQGADGDNANFLTSGAGGHSHAFTTDGNGSHGHNVGIGATGGNQAHAHGIGGDGAHSHNISAAGDHAHSATIDVRPPYYALAYVMKL